MILIRSASEPPEEFLFWIITLPVNGLFAGVPRRQPVCPGPSMSISFWRLRTGWVMLPGFVLLPTLDATRSHVPRAACPEDEDSPMLPSSSAIDATTAG